MAVGLGMDEGEWKELRHQMDNSFWVMRIIGYPSLTNDHDGYSCGAHKDYGCLTYVKGVIIIISFMQVNKLKKIGFCTLIPRLRPFKYGGVRDQSYQPRIINV